MPIRAPAPWYLKRLILPGERKSVEPMAARVYPDNVRSAHQSMHHLVAAAGWSDRAVLAATSRRVGARAVEGRPSVLVDPDDTSHVKKGRHSVGVARQYCGRLGKQDNCLTLGAASKRLQNPPQMLGERRSGLWGFVREYVLSLAGVLALGFLLVISMLLSAGLAAMGKYMGGALPEPRLHALAFAVAFLTTTAMFALLFK
jgi:hypothetical protein